jgi:hypothetical protein
MENKENNDEVTIKLEKQKLMREEIINKGYDSIKFIEYLIQCKGPGGENINNWSITDLKNAIKDFIYLCENSKNEINKEVKSEPQKPELNKIESDKNIDMSAPSAPKEKNLGESFLMSVIDIKNNIFSDSSKQNEKIDYGLKTPDSLNCRPLDNTDLGKQEEIYIKIGFPEKVDGGFFSRDTVSFTVAAIPLGFVVKRNYLDFEWLRDILIKLYNINFIPSLPSLFLYNKENEDSFYKECIRNLEKFMNYLLNDPIIKNSQILFDFLCQENEKEFLKMKKDFENTTPNNDIQNYQSISGKIDINITENAEKKFDGIKNFAYENEKLYRQLYNNLNEIEENFNKIIKQINETVVIFDKLFNLSNKYLPQENTQKIVYTQMKIMFLSLSKTFKMEKDVIKIDIKENFNFFYKNYSNFNQLIKKVEEAKRVYKKEEKDLVSLKNDLYNKKGGSEINENVDLSKLLPKNTEATLDMKKNYGFYLNKTLSEFERMKFLDVDLFKNQITKGFKSQNNLINIFSKDIKSILEEIDKIEKFDIKNEIKEDKKAINNEK